MVAVPEPERFLVGRGLELEALERGYRRTRGRGTGEVHAVVVRGPAGVGKGALIEAHLEARRREGALILVARCHPGGLVPYGPFDEIAAALGEALAALPEAELAARLPRDLALAATILPGLGRSRVIAEEARKGIPDGDAVQLRHRAFGALAELLSELARRRGVVVWVDDGEWLDADAAALLRHVLRSVRHAPPIQMVVAERERAEVRLPALFEELTLGPLAEEPAVQLVRRRVGDAGADAHLEVARQAGGNPRLLVSLSRWLPARVDIPVEGAAVELYRRRLETLEPEIQRLLAVVAVAAEPVPVAVARRAAGVDQRAVDYLLARGWLRPAQARDREAVDSIDRDVHDAVIALLPEAVRAKRYRDLAAQLALCGDGDAEAIARAYHRGGELHLAGDYAAIAAARADRRLAFDRAAFFYRMALALWPLEHPDRHRLRVAQGEALAHLGRAVDAAELLAEARAEVSGAEALALSRRVLEEYLLAGEIDDAVRTARALVGDEVMTVLEGRRARRPPALRSRRAALRWHARRFDRLRELDLPLDALAPVDAWWALGAGMLAADHDLALACHTRHLLGALRVGEPRRVARGLALEAALLAAGGEPNLRRADNALREARALAERLGDAYTDAFVEYAAGVAPASSGHWREALGHWREGTRLLESGCRCIGFEPAPLALSEVVALFYLGELDELSTRVPEAIEVAEERGDRLGAAALRGGHGIIAWLARDDIDGATAALEEARRAWHEPTPNMLHGDLLARVHLALYRGDGAAAWRAVEDDWDQMRQASYERLQRERVEVLHARAMAALAAAARGGPTDLIDLAEHTGRQLTQVRTAWTSALGQLIRAGAFAARGDAERAISWLRAAESSLERIEMIAHAAAARRRRGELVGGAAGNTLIASADAVLRTRGAASPAHVSDMLVPPLRG